MLRFWLLFFPGLLLTGTLQAQVFEAYADARQVVLNSYFEVSFTLHNADALDFRPPPFDDFTVVSGPSRSVQTSMVNRQVSTSVSYIYTLQPKRLGKFTIGPAVMKYNGRELRTDPLVIEVVKGKAAAATPEEEVFIKAEPSVPEAYIGQQILLDYRLYTTINIDNYNIVQESDYPGFFANEIRRFDSRVQREIINGTQYALKNLRRVALFPQQAGLLTVDPMVVQLGIMEGNDQRRRGLLFNRRVRRQPAQTEPVQITVRSLPDGAPPSFTGAVGRFNITTDLSRNTVTTDDALALRLTISGTGDIKRVQPPPVDPEGRFEVYDPTIQEETSYELNGELTGKKTIEYLLLPKEPGTYMLQPTFSYFDPDSAAYVTLAPQIYTVNVRPGARRPGETALSDPLAELREDIHYLKGDTDLSKHVQPFFGSPAFWTLAALPFFLLAGAVVIKQRQRRLSNLDPGLIRQRRARKEAERRLQTADRYRKEGQPRAFYDEISKAMLGYVSDKLSLPRSELTKDNVRSRLEALKVSATDIEKFLQVMHNCEIALFAGRDNTEAMNETYENSAGVLAKIEAALT